MADQPTIDGLLEGAFDTHIHSAPDVLPRKFNDIELAQRFKARRMAGFVLKSHYICTADRATLVNQIVPEVQAFGAIALNNSVGGADVVRLEDKARHAAGLEALRQFEVIELAGEDVRRTVDVGVEGPVEEAIDRRLLNHM